MSFPSYTTGKWIFTLVERKSLLNTIMYLLIHLWTWRKNLPWRFKVRSAMILRIIFWGHKLEKILSLKSWSSSVKIDLNFGSPTSQVYLLNFSIRIKRKKLSNRNSLNRFWIEAWIVGLTSINFTQIFGVSLKNETTGGNVADEGKNKFSLWFPNIFLLFGVYVVRHRFCLCFESRNEVLSIISIIIGLLILLSHC